LSSSQATCEQPEQREQSEQREQREQREQCEREHDDDHELVIDDRELVVDDRELVVVDREAKPCATSSAVMPNSARSDH